MGVKGRGIARRLARRLKMLRKQCRMSLDEVSRLMRFSDSKLGRIENCENRIGFHELKSLLDIYGVTADKWPEYIEMWEASQVGGWWRAFGLDDKGYVPLEADASLVRNFSLASVPGLLQTADYSRASFRAALRQRSTEQLRKDIAVRTIRQKRLVSSTDPLELIAIVDESALHRPTGSPRVMAAQFARLIEQSALDTVTLQILPTGLGPHPGQSGSFSILSFGDLGEPDVAYAEHPLGAVHTEKENVVTEATLRFDRLRSDALSPDETVTLIRQVAERY